jgi:ATP-dependent helicase/DNAse subunit B
MIYRDLTRVEFIKEEDFIEDKENAIEKLINIIEDLKSAKADAIFKLKAKKLMLAIEKITDSELIERIKIMIDGMLEASGDSNNEKNISMMKKITSLFCDETVV